MAQPTNRGADDSSRGMGLFITSAVVIFIVLVLAVFVVVTGDGDDSDSAAPQQTSDPAASNGGNDGGSGADGGSGEGTPPPAGCSPTDTDQTVLTTAPEDVTWDLVNTVALPRSSSAGPLAVDGMTASCYARTPLGAVMASMNAFYRSVLAAPDVEPLRTQVLPGEGRDVLEAQLAGVDEPIQSGDMAQIAGFRVASYTDEIAVVSLVNGDANAGSLKSTDVTVQWADGDWKLVVRDDGSLSTPADSLSDLIGYVQFGGV
jgi:hypothetical protein